MAPGKDGHPVVSHYTHWLARRKIKLGQGKVFDQNNFIKKLSIDQDFLS